MKVCIEACIEHRTKSSNFFQDYDEFKNCELDFYLMRKEHNNRKLVKIQFKSFTENCHVSS